MRCCALKTSQTQRVTETESPAESVLLEKAEIQAFFGWRFQGLTIWNECGFFSTATNGGPAHRVATMGRRALGRPGGRRSEQNPVSNRGRVSALGHQDRLAGPA